MIHLDLSDVVYLMYYMYDLYMCQDLYNCTNTVYNMKKHLNFKTNL